MDIEKYLHQQSTAWRPFCRISSRKTVNMKCIYWAVRCGFLIMFWIFHWKWLFELEGTLVGMIMYKSCHLVLVALRVKNNVGVPICGIMSVRSDHHLFQKYHVPHRPEPTHIIFSSNIESGESRRHCRQSETFVGKLFSMYFFKKKLAFVWLRGAI